MLRKLVLSFLALFIAILLTACTDVPPTVQPQVSPVQSPENASASLPTQASPLATPAPTDAPVQPGTGVLKAEIHRFDGSPIKGVIVYAALIEDRGGMRLSAVDPLLDPRAETDGNGQFVIKNLKPGDYALATQSPVGIIMPHNTQGATVTYQVEADKTTDLGRVDVGYTYPDAQ